MKAESKISVAWYVRMPYATHGWAASCGEPYIELFAFGTYPDQK